MAVNTHTQNLGVYGLEFVQYGLNPRHLLASGGGPIQGIEYKHHIFLLLELTQGKILFSQMTG